jgi:hypothetical protein
MHHRENDRTEGVRTVETPWAAHQQQKLKNFRFIIIVITISTIRNTLGGTAFRPDKFIVTIIIK